MISQDRGFRMIVSAIILIVAAMPAALRSEEDDQFDSYPLWAVRGVSPIEMATGGLGSALQDDPSYLLWKPSLIAQVDRSKFSVSHISSPVRGGLFSRAEFLGYSRAGEKWVFALGASNRTVQEERVFREDNSTFSMNMLAFSANYIFGDIEGEEDFWYSAGISSRMIFEHATVSEMANYGISLDLNTLISYRNIISAGVDLFGIGPVWHEQDVIGEAPEEEIERVKQSGSYRDQALHFATYLRFPFIDNVWLGENLSIATGVFLKNSEQPDYAASASYRIALVDFMEESSAFAPVTFHLHSGYSDFNGFGYGIGIGYYDISVNYSWAKDLSPGHFFTVQIPFGANIWSERERAAARKKDYRQLFDSAKESFDRFISGRYYSPVEADNLSRLTSLSLESCRSDCDSAAALAGLVNEVRTLKGGLDEASAAGDVDEARSSLARIDEKIRAYRNLSPVFMEGESEILDVIERSLSDLDSGPRIVLSDTVDLGPVRRYIGSLEENILAIGGIEKALLGQSAGSAGIGGSTLKNISEDGRMAGGPRFEMLRTLRSSLVNAIEEYSPYVVLSSSDISVGPPHLLSECIGSTEGIDACRVVIRNRNRSETVSDLSSSLLDQGEPVVWNESANDIAIIPPGDSAEVVLGIEPASGFYRLQKGECRDCIIELSYRMGGRFFHDRIEGLSVCVEDPRVINRSCLRDPGCLAAFVDSTDPVVGKAAEKVKTVLRAMSRTYRLPGPPEGYMEDHLLLAMAAYRLITTNIPDDDQGAVRGTAGTQGGADERFPGPSTRLSTSGEAFRDGRASAGEKAVYYASLLTALDIPCSLTYLRSCWVVLLREDQMSSRYAGSLASASIDGSGYIPLAISGDPENLIESNSEGLRIIESSLADRHFLERTREMKPRLLSVKKNDLLTDDGTIEFASLLVEMPYEEYTRKDKNPFLSVEEEIDIRLKLAFVYGVKNENQKVFDQFFKLLCLDDRRDWLAESGMMRQSVRAEWESARSSYRHIDLVHDDSPVELGFEIIDLPIGSVIPSLEEIDPGRELTIDLPSMFEEFSRLSSTTR